MRRIGRVGGIGIGIITAALLISGRPLMGLSLERDPIEATQSEAVPAPKENSKKPRQLPATPTFKISHTEKFLTHPPVKKPEGSPSEKARRGGFLEFWKKRAGWFGGKIRKEKRESRGKRGEGVEGQIEESEE